MEKLPGISETNYLNRRYLHIRYDPTYDSCGCVTVDVGLTSVIFVAPNLLRIDSKGFIVDRSDKLYPTDFDISRLAIKQSPNSYSGHYCAIMSTWHHDQYFN